jgi:hypothetical protein
VDDSITYPVDFEVAEFQESPQSSAISRQPSAISHQPSAVSRQPMPVSIQADD